MPEKLTSNDGYCHDCMNNGKRAPFTLYTEQDYIGHWFCSYCGSNHVTVKLYGETIEQGDLYPLPE